MAKRPTIADVALRSGVSVATVDRVLNGRLPVREDTKRRVYEAAKALGFHATSLIRQRIETTVRLLPLGFLLQKPESPFYRAFEARLVEATEAYAEARIECHIDFVGEQAATTVAAKLRELGARCAAVAMVAIDHPTITAAVAELAARGVSVFALLSDSATGVRAGYLGVNNRKAGRTAGWLIHRTSRRTGRVAVFVGSHRFLGHELREIGLKTYLREYAPDFLVLDSLVNLEDPRIAYEATRDLIARQPDLVGIYVAGGGMDGVIRALRDEPPAEPLAVVVHELIPDTRAALADGVITAVVSTPLEALSRDLVGTMARAAAGGVTSAPMQRFLPFDLIVSENL